jgi:prepilin signal peptidase PulO-like enzyme (type II secretory pathway)
LAVHTLHVPFTFVLALWAICLTFLAKEDAATSTIPSVQTLTVAILSVLKVALYSSLNDLIINLASATIVTFLLWFTTGVYWRRYGHEALGLGDVKLIGALTIWFGPLEIWTVLLVASIGGIAFGLMRLAKGQEAGHIPFGPFLSFAAIFQALLDFWSAA